MKVFNQKTEISRITKDTYKKKHDQLYAALLWIQISKFFKKEWNNTFCEKLTPKKSLGGYINITQNRFLVTYCSKMKE